MRLAQSPGFGVRSSAQEFFDRSLVDPGEAVPASLARFAATGSRALENGDGGPAPMLDFTNNGQREGPCVASI